MEFVVIYERGETNWGAIVPDLPGCVSIGDTLEEAQQNVREAIELYLEVLTERENSKLNERVETNDENTSRT